jgi:hypothetical protein
MITIYITERFSVVTDPFNFYLQTDPVVTFLAQPSQRTTLQVLKLDHKRRSSGTREKAL